MGFSAMNVLLAGMLLHRGGHYAIFRQQSFNLNMVPVAVMVAPGAKRPARARPAARYVTAHFLKIAHNLLEIKIFLILYERTGAIFGLT